MNALLADPALQTRSFAPGKVFGLSSYSTPDELAYHREVEFNTDTPTLDALRAEWRTLVDKPKAAADGVFYNNSEWNAFVSWCQGLGLEVSQGLEYASYEEVNEARRTINERRSQGNFYAFHISSEAV